MGEPQRTRVDLRWLEAAASGWPSQLVGAVRLIGSILWQADRRVTLAMVGLGAVAGTLIFPAVYLEKLILDRIVANVGSARWKQELYAIGLLIGLRLLIEAIGSILEVLVGFYRNYASRLLNQRLNLIIAERISKLDVLTFDDAAFQERFSKVERESTRRAFALMLPLSSLPGLAMSFLSAVGILWFLHPLVALGIVLISLPLTRIHGRYIRAEYDFEDSMGSRYMTQGWLGSYLKRTRSFLELRVLGIQDFLIGRLDSVQNEILRGVIALNRARMRAHILAYLPRTLFYLAVNLYLAVLVLLGRITIGSYQMFLRSLLSAQQSFSGLTSALLQVYENAIFVQDLHWFLQLQPRLQEPAEPRPPQRLTEGIELRDVWFRYREDMDWVLQGVSVRLRCGERVGLVGENGAGKSTFIKLLARYYDPQRGAVLADGVDARQFDSRAHQSRFSILFQSFEMYPFSARETIGYGDVRRIEDQAAIRASAASTGIGEYVESLPLGFENPLHPHLPGGVEPSKGQWQRLALARILFREHAEVLVLDEPTSNVDPEAEERIFNELLSEPRDRIVLFVSQTFSTVRRADRILVFDQGRILEQGTHEELMALGGKYARLFALQAKGYR